MRLQEGDDLGERLSRCFQNAFAEGAERLVVLGSDSPTLPLALPDRAFAALATTAVVLGPAQDGGYYLVGASRLVPEMFRGIAWGGPQVLAQSLSALAHAGLTPELLPTWYDVDTMADVEALEREIDGLRREARPFPRRVADALSSLREA